MSQLPNNPNIKPAITTHTFRQFCQKVLPSVYDDSLSYYELLCKLTAKINEVITANNQNSEAITELQELYKQLKSYVDNYFQTLDLEPEIEQALDKMAEDGDLATIISQYLGGINVYGYKTKSDMKNAEVLGAGAICRTLGETDYKTGNGNYYYIRQYLTTDVIDDDNIVAIPNKPEIIAEKIPDYFYDTITSNIGDLSNLTTTDKTSTVGAINEVKGVADTNTTNIGTLSNLTTTEKSSLVGAINEIGSIMPIYVPEWFPELKTKLSGATFGTGPTYSVGAKQATYLKMGRLVFLTLYLKITLSNVGDSSGYAAIGNLPFVANNNQRYPLTVAEFGTNIIKSFSDNNMHEVRAFIDSGQNFIKLYDVSGANAMKWVTSGNSANISISGFYLTN